MLPNILLQQSRLYDVHLWHYLLDKNITIKYDDIPAIYDSLLTLSKLKAGTQQNLFIYWLD